MVWPPAKNVQNNYKMHTVAVVLENSFEEIEAITPYDNFAKKCKFIASICATPALVLTKTNVIDDKNVTCYPWMEENFKNSNYQNEKVIVDGKVITSQGPAISIDF